MSQFRGTANLAGFPGLQGLKRRTTTRIKPTSAVKAFGFSALAAYPPPRSP
jgi:hypothetical protein